MRLVVERLAHVRLLARAEHRARALLSWLREGEADWNEVLEAAESLVPGFAPEAAAGCVIAAEAVARRIEWEGPSTEITTIELASRPAFRLLKAEKVVVCVTARPHETPALLQAARGLSAMDRLDVVLTPEEDQDPHLILDELIADMQRLSNNAASFSDGAFEGALYESETGAYVFPGEAEQWAGFANTSGIFPITFVEGGKLTFVASAETPTTVRFRFEANPFPDTEPSYDTVEILIDSTSLTEYTIPIPSQDSQTFNSFLMYIIERDQPVVVTDVLIEATSYEVENNSFTWSVSEDGKVILENGSGLTVEIAQNVRYLDGLSEMLITSLDPRL